MNTTRLTTLILLLCVVFSPLASEASLIYFPQGFEIATMVEHNDLIVVGTVSSAEFVFRPETPPQYTTDIVINVQEVIKGEPNAGPERVKFMVPGGTGVNPRTGKFRTCVADGVPDFMLNERVLVFLRKNPNPLPPLPHDRLSLSFGHFGKRVIKNGRLEIPYTFKKEEFDEFFQTIKEKPYDRIIDLPLDLVIQIARSSMKDYDATKPLENVIKKTILNTPEDSKAELSVEQIDNLKDESKRILEKKDD